METVEQIFEKIMLERNWDKQQLAEYIGVHPSVLSQKLGTQWNAHWRIFVKLLPDMIALKIIDNKLRCATSDKKIAKKVTELSKSKDDLPKKPGLTDDIMETLAYFPNYSSVLR